MSNRNAPAHMAGSGGRRGRTGSSSQRSGSGSARNGITRRSADDRASRPRREQLNDNYYYEEPKNGWQEEFQDVSSYSSPQKRREGQNAGKKKMSRGKKAAIIIAVVLVLLIAFGLWYVFGYMLGGLHYKEITKDPVKLGIDDLTSAVSSMEAGDAPVVLDDKITSIAMFGVDNRGASFEGNSDVIMILTVDNRHQKIKMTSIARDTCVDVEGSGYDKINAAYSWGGPELAINTLNRNFRTDQFKPHISEYVTVNFAKMADIIDACGGVDIKLTGAEVREINSNLWNLSVDVGDRIESDKYDGSYEDRDDYAFIANTDIIPNIYGNRSLDSSAEEYADGTYTLNGNQAVAYGRIRYIGNDDARMGRQQTVLKALIEKVRGKSKLEYPSMINKIMPMCETSLDLGDIMGLLPIMFTDFTIETMTLPNEEVSPCGAKLAKNGGWVYLYDLDAAAKHICNFIYEKDSPYYGQEIDAYTPDFEGVYIDDGSGYGGEIFEVDPTSSEPVSSSPVSSDPTSSDPTSSDPSSSDPTSSDPTYSDPAYSDPVSSEPTDFDPNGGESGENTGSGGEIDLTESGGEGETVDWSAEPAPEDEGGESVDGADSGDTGETYQ